MPSAVYQAFWFSPPFAVSKLVILELEPLTAKA